MARPVQATPETGFQPHPRDVSALAGDAKSLLINSPNNPTGVVYTEETMRNMAKLANDHDLWLISDEVYDSQVWNGRHISA